MLCLLDFHRFSLFPIVGVTAVDVELLPLFIPSRCRFSKPADDPSPRYDPANGTMVCHMDGTFGEYLFPTYTASKLPWLFPVSQVGLTVLESLVFTHSEIRIL